MIAKISKETYKDNEKWLKNHPELSVGCYVRENRDGEISLRLERISDITSNTGRYIPGWEEIPYPEFMQESIQIPAFITRDMQKHEIMLEWF